MATLIHITMITGKQLDGREVKTKKWRVNGLGMVVVVEAISIVHKIRYPFICPTMGKFLSLTTVVHTYRYTHTVHVSKLYRK